MRVLSLRNGGMRAALERRNGVEGGGCTFFPRGRKGGETQVTPEKENEGSPPSPVKERMEGSRAPEARTEGCVFPEKEERTEGCGEREGDAGPCWEQPCSPRNERRDAAPLPARDARCLLRAGVLNREQESLPSFFPPFHPFHHFLCVFCVYSSLFPPILAESKASQVTIYMNRQVFLAVILFRER